jgi:uncharacterized membrane protein YdbT with pleckstrin-like domain
MFEFEQKYRRGKKTFLFLYIKHAWLSNLIGIGLFYLAWSVYAGSLNAPAANILTAHPNWYITVSMLSQWLVLLASAALIFGFMQAHVIYAHYKFILDDNAFNLYRGLFFTRETTIPYQQISNVNITRPYHYRIFGIAQLDILTAADKGMVQQEGKKDAKKMLIPIIDMSVARKLSRQLMECMSKKRRGEDLYATDFEIEDEDDAVESETTEPAKAEEIEEIAPEIFETPEKEFDIDDLEDKDMIIQAKASEEEDLYPTIDLRKL